jgi:hypothetical protein
MHEDEPTASPRIAPGLNRLHGSARPLGSVQQPSRGLYDVGPDQLRAGGVSIGFGGAGSGTIPVVQGAVGLMVAQINQHRFPPRRRAAPSRFQSLLRFSVLFRLLQSVRGELSYDQPVHHPAPRIVHRRSVDDVAPHCRRSSAPPRRRASAAGEALAPSPASMAGFCPAAWRAAQLGRTSIRLDPQAEQRNPPHASGNGVSAA